VLSRALIRGLFVNYNCLLPLDGFIQFGDLGVMSRLILGTLLLEFKLQFHLCIFLRLLLGASLAAARLLFEALVGSFVAFEARPFQQSLAFHLGVVMQLVAFRRTLVNVAVQHDSTNLC